MHYYSVLVDGSTDASNKEKEVIFILYVDPSTGKPKLRFFSLKKVDQATASGILATIKQSFEDHGVESYNDHTVGLGADGASVNLGARRGLATLMKEDEGIEWLVAVHCVSHRLELSIADAVKSTFFSEISEMLLKLFYLYKNSPKKMRQLAGIADAMEMDISSPTKATGTRWLEHKIRAMKWLSVNYGLVLTHLSHLVEDQSYPAAERQKFKGLYNKYRNTMYPLYVEYFLEILMPAAELSLLFQRESIDVVEVMRGVKTFFRIMEKLKESPEIIFDTGRVRGFLGSVDAENDEENDQRNRHIYKNVPLTHFDRAKNSLNSSNGNILSQITECFTVRFDMTNSGNLFSVLVKVLDTEFYPGEGMDDDYGTEEIRVLTDRFCSLLTANGCDITRIEREWDMLKQFVVTTGLRNMKYSDVWAKILTCSKKQSFENILHVIEILMVIPVSNAVLERMFSAMNRVHNDWRNNLGEKRVEHLLRIIADGPEPEDFESEASFARWDAKRDRRPNVPPSGPRATTSSTSKRKQLVSEVTETVKKILVQAQPADPEKAPGDVADTGEAILID